MHGANIKTASIMFMFVSWPTGMLANIHHCSCNLLVHFSAWIRSTVIQQEPNCNILYTVYCGTVYALNVWQIRSRIFLFCAFSQNSRDKISSLRTSSQYMHYGDTHKAYDAYSWNTMGFILGARKWGNVWKVRRRSKLLWEQVDMVWHIA
jgi:hypothetical protein